MIEISRLAIKQSDLG